MARSEPPDRSLQSLREWWHSTPSQSPPIVFVTGPRSYAKQGVIGAFAAELAASDAGILRLGTLVKPEDIDALDEFLEDLTEGTTASAPRILIVDDLEELSHTKGARAKVKHGIEHPEELVQSGWRLVIGLAREPEIKHAQFMSTEPRYIHPRPALLESITRWVTSSASLGQMFVTGPPGSGKTFLLKDAVRVMSELPGVTVAHAAIRDWTSDAVADMSIAKLRNDVSEALSAEGLSLTDLAATAAAGTTVLVEQDIEVNYGTVTGANITMRDPASAYAEELIAALSARTARDPAAPTLVLVIDALDELEIFGVAALPALRALLSHHSDFASWNLKVLLSGQYKPDRIGVAEPLDLADVDAGQDLSDFAAVRLSGTSIPQAEHARLAEQVTRLSGGLFLVASGYLDELAEGQLTAADLADAPTAATAVQYYVTALGRIRQQYLTTGEEEQWANAHRFLSMLAVVPHGRSAADMADAWTELDAPNSDEWDFVDGWIGKSALRRYVASQGNGRHYRFVHSASRTAIGQLERVRPWEMRTSVRAERDRWIRTRTPLDGTGGWDPVGGRVAMAEVGMILAEMLDEGGSGEARTWARRLIEGWDWMELCALHAKPEAKVPLGIPQVLHQLDLMIRADPALAELTLWSAEEPAPVPPPRPVPRPAPRPAKRPGRPRYVARAHDPYIEDVLNNRAWFNTKSGAEATMKKIAGRYVISKDSKFFDEREKLILFIRGFNLDPAQSLAGVKGHHARLWVAEEQGRWSIKAEECEVTGGTPFREQEPTYIPDWNEPLLRRVRGNSKPGALPPRPYALREEAEAELKAFVSRTGSARPLNGKIRVHVYDRSGAPFHPVSGKRLTITQVELVIVTAPGGFEIEARILGYSRNNEFLSRADYLESLE